jgi:hypothetical protein
MSKKKSVRLMESFITYENHGDIVFNFDHFPELEGKSNEELQDWLNQHYCDLYIDCNTLELRKDNKIVYEEEDLAYYAENPDEKPEDDIDEDIWELAEFWSQTEVEWDRIKCEERTMYVQEDLE